MELHLITDRALASSSLSDLCARAAAAGVDVIQVREGGLPDRDLLSLVGKILAGASPRGTCVLVNDRFDIALAAGAGGVHLKSSGIPTRRVRGATPRGFRIGRSVHSADEAREAAAEGADYVIAGPVFPTPSKARFGRPPLGLEGLRGIARSVRIPVIAVGGIGPEELDSVLQAGATGAAAIRALLAAGDIGSAVRNFRRRAGGEWSDS